ncbi:MAG TPA: hypothetical protein VLE69_01530 [Candidatus Saccharimonadales bacterium]|nr:hypothetical protein [Candidatus Saccharimonadales bacterium]
MNNNDKRKESLLNRRISTGLSHNAEATVVGAGISFILFLLFGLWLYIGSSRSSAADESAGLGGVFGAFFLFVAFFILLYIIWVIDKDLRKR